MNENDIIERRIKSTPISFPALIFGILWNGFLIYTIINIHNPTESTSLLIIISIFFLVGLYLIYYGITSKRNEILEITAKEVRFERTNWRGKKSGWKEQISRYCGLMVIPRSVTVRKDHDITVYDIDLLHKENKPNITIRTFYDLTITRGPIENYARQLGLSVLEKDIHGELIERTVEELNEKLTDRIRKGKMQRTYASNRAYKSRKYKLSETSEGFILTRPYYGVLAIGISMIFGASYLMVKSTLPLGFDFALLVCGVFMTFGGLSKEKLEVKNGTIIFKTLILNKEFSVKTINMSDIEDISIRNNPTYGNVKSLNQGIRISSDKTELYFAQYTPLSEREWIIDKLIDLTIKQDF